MYTPTDSRSSALATAHWPGPSTTSDDQHNPGPSGPCPRCHKVHPSATSLHIYLVLLFISATFIGVAVSTSYWIVTQSHHHAGIWMRYHNSKDKPPTNTSNNSLDGATSNYTVWIELTRYFMLTTVLLILFSLVASTVALREWCKCEVAVHVLNVFGILSTSLSLSMYGANYSIRWRAKKAELGWSYGLLIAGCTTWIFAYIIVLVHYCCHNKFKTLVDAASEPKTSNAGKPTGARQTRRRNRGRSARASHRHSKAGEVETCPIVDSILQCEATGSLHLSSSSKHLTGTSRHGSARPMGSPDTGHTSDERGTSQDTSKDEVSVTTLN